MVDFSFELEKYVLGDNVSNIRPYVIVGKYRPSLMPFSNTDAK
jgi:hypothetical protein